MAVSISTSGAPSTSSSRVPGRRPTVKPTPPGEAGRLVDQTPIVRVAVETPFPGPFVGFRMSRDRAVAGDRPAHHMLRAAGGLRNVVGVQIDPVQVRPTMGDGGAVPLVLVAAPQAGPFHGDGGKIDVGVTGLLEGGVLAEDDRNDGRLAAQGDGHFAGVDVSHRHLRQLDLVGGEDHGRVEGRAEGQQEVIVPHPFQIANLRAAGRQGDQHMSGAVGHRQLAPLRGRRDKGEPVAFGRQLEQAGLDVGETAIGLERNLGARRLRDRAQKDRRGDPQKLTHIVPLEVATVQLRPPFGSREEAFAPHDFGGRRLIAGPSADTAPPAPRAG